MSKNRNDHKKPAVAKDRFVGVRLDKESFSKVEEAAMAAGVHPAERDRRHNIFCHGRLRWNGGAGQENGARHDRKIYG